MVKLYIIAFYVVYK